MTSPGFDIESPAPAPTRILPGGPVPFRLGADETSELITDVTHGVWLELLGSRRLNAKAFPVSAVRAAVWKAFASRLEGGTLALAGPVPVEALEREVAAGVLAQFREEGDDERAGVAAAAGVRQATRLAILRSLHGVGRPALRDRAGA